MDIKIDGDRNMYNPTITIATPDYVMNGPPVTTELVRWHQYPAEKPTKPGRYLVEIPLNTIPVYYSMEVIYWGKSSECEWKDKKLKRKKGYWYNYDGEWGDYEVTSVIAWMPLPEPYIPEEKKNEKV